MKRKSEARPTTIAEHPTGDQRSRERGESGSVLTAGALFVVLFLLIAALGVDISNYFYQEMQLQQIADGAALTGAGSINQAKNLPKMKHVQKAVIDYVKTHKGSQNIGLYRGSRLRDARGIELAPQFSRKLARRASCIPEFNVKNGSLALSQPATVDIRFLGSAITDGNGNRFYVTTKMSMTNAGGESHNTHPWGPYQNPTRGNVNTGEYRPPVMLDSSDSRATINAWGQSWDPEGDFYIEVSTDPDHKHSDHTRILRNGDYLPNVGGGAHNQGDVASFLDEYVDEQGRVMLNQNELVILFELGTKDDLSTDQKARRSSVADFQDLVLLVKLETPRFQSENEAVNTVEGWAGKITPVCAGIYYRVGVTVANQFRSNFLPAGLFDRIPLPMFASAAAEARPEFYKKHSLIRNGDSGVITSDLTYEYRDPRRVNVRRYYGVKGKLGAACSPDRAFIKCNNMEELIDRLGQRIELDKQILFLENGSLEINGTETNAVHALTGEGYVFVDKPGLALRIRKEGPSDPIINGQLDLVTLNGDISFSGFGDTFYAQAYFMAPRGRIRFSQGMDVPFVLGGGLHAGKGPIRFRDTTLELTAEDFCPSTRQSRLCRFKNMTVPGAPPYNWSVSLIQ